MVDANIWFVSDDGSDDNDCDSVSAPCRNLQTVVDRATDGADIYVTSNTLSLDFVFKIQNRYIHYRRYCVISSNLSYTLRSYHNSSIKLTCAGICIYLLVLYWQTHCMTAPMSYFLDYINGIMTDLNYLY